MSGPEEAAGLNAEMNRRIRGEDLGPPDSAEPGAASDGAGLRRTIAAEKGMTAPAFVKALRGETREDIEREADELLSALGYREPPPPVPDFDGGVRQSVAPPQVDPNAEMNRTIRAALEERRAGRDESL